MPFLLMNYVIGTGFATLMFGSAFGALGAIVMIMFCGLCAAAAWQAWRQSRELRGVDVKVESLSTQQERLAMEVARNRGEIDRMKDDLAVAAKKIGDGGVMAEKAETILSGLKRQYEKMSLRPRADIAPVAPAPASTGVSRFPIREKIDIIETAEPMSEQMLAALLHQAIETDKVDAFAQPIVRLPSRKPAYLEMFARIRAKPGVYVPAHQYRAIAEKEQLLTAIDNILLLKCLDTIQQDARRGAHMTYFLNIAGPSLKDARFMADLLTFIKSRRDLSDRIVFEFPQKDLLSLSGAMSQVVAGLSTLGCRFSIDHVDTPMFDIAKLETRNVKFIKIPASRILALGNNREGQALFNKLRRTMDNAGITLIAEKIENNETLREILDFDVDYGAGFLFGRPDLEGVYKTRNVA